MRRRDRSTPEGVRRTVLALLLTCAALLLLAARSAWPAATAPQPAAPIAKSPAPSLTDDIRALRDAGRLPDAEALARARLAETEASRGPNSLETAQVLDALAETLWMQSKTKGPEGRGLAERAVQIKETLLGPDDPQVARSLQHLAQFLIGQNARADADRALSRALAILERGAPPDSLAIATVLDQQARLFRLQGEYPQALPLHERALAIRERAVGPNAHEVAVSLGNLGRLHKDMGALDAALPLLKRALAIDLAAYGPQDRRVAFAQLDLADVLWAMSKLEEAKQLSASALATDQALYGPDHPELIAPLRLLGQVVMAQGDLEAARELFERQLTLALKHHGEQHALTADALNSLGDLSQRLGDNERARNDLQRSLQIEQALFGPNHPNVAATLLNLSNVEQSVGNYTEARALLQRTLQLDAAAYGEDHPYLAEDHNNLAGMSDLLGEPEAALAEQAQALAIARKALGPQHPTVGIYLGNQATYLAQAGRPEQARASSDSALAVLEGATGVAPQTLAKLLVDRADLLVGIDDAARGAGTGPAQTRALADARAALERAIGLYEGSLPGGHPELVRARERLGAVLARLGDPKAALPLLQNAPRELAATLGPEHPDVGDAQRELARAQLALGNWGDACASAARAEEIGRAHFRLVARGLSERQALSYAAVRATGSDLALAAAAASEPAQRPGLVRSAWDAVIRSRALVLDEMAARHWSATASADTQVQSLERALQRARARLAALVVRGGAEGAAPGLDRVTAARARAEELERALAGRVAALGRQVARDRVGIDEVLAALPAGSALVAYAWSGDLATPARLCALVARSPAAGASGVSPPALVALRVGANALDSLVTRWRQTIGEGSAPAGPFANQAEQACRAAGAQLRAAVWDPLQAAIGDAALVFVVAESALQLVNLDALPAPDGGYLVESGPTVHLLTAERDLVASTTIAQAGRARAQPAAVLPAKTALLAVGGPDFDADPRAPRDRTPASETQVAFRGGRSACDDPHALSFHPLPHAAAEARSVAVLVRHTSAAGAVSLLTGEAATEEQVKRAASSARLLHVATHGFIVGGDCRDRTGALPRHGGGENPLLACGLALAGANRRDRAPAGAEDGILTGEEIASLDLSAARWAVLSACDTGGGDVRAGEGVLGLRRSFQIAGAQTLIMSLWPVEDATARAWMEALYTARFQRRTDTASAVRDADLALLAARRRAGLDTHPFHWAAFVAAGDWR